MQNLCHLFFRKQHSYYESCDHLGPSCYHCEHLHRRTLSQYNRAAAHRRKRFCYSFDDNDEIIFTEHNRSSGANVPNMSLRKMPNSSSNSKLVQERTDVNSTKSNCKKSIKDKLDTISKRIIPRMEEPNVDLRTKVNAKKRSGESNCKENMKMSGIENSNSFSQVLQTDKNCNRENSTDAKKHKIPVCDEQTVEVKCKRKAANSEVSSCDNAAAPSSVSSGVEVKCKKKTVSSCDSATAPSSRNQISFRIPKRSFATQSGNKVEKTKNLESKQFPRFVKGIHSTDHSKQRIQTSARKISVSRRSSKEGEFLKLFLFIL